MAPLDLRLDVFCFISYYEYQATVMASLFHSGFRGHTGDLRYLDKAYKRSRKSGYHFVYYASNQGGFQELSSSLAVYVADFLCLLILVNIK